MAHIKLFAICLNLLVFICSAWLSLAHSSQGQDVDVDSSAKGLMEDERLATDTRKRIKERKLAMDSIMKQEKKKKKEDAGAGAVAGTTTSKISRSNQVAGKYETIEEGIKGKISGSNVVERKGSSFTRSSEVKNIDDETGFIPFNADYQHPPRHHPPKNN